MLSSDIHPLLSWLKWESQQPYLHPEQIAVRAAPEGLRHDLWLPIVRCWRTARRQDVAYIDSNGQTFWFVVPDSLSAILHALDQARADFQPTENAEVEHAARVVGQMDEAWGSACLEGGILDRFITRELLRNHLNARQVAEQQAIELYKVQRKLKKLAMEPITPEALISLQESILGDAGQVGANDADRSKLERLCAFAERSSEKFMHPLLHAAATHFFLLHEQPFVAGLGPAGRLVYQWLAMRAGYSFLHGISPAASLLESGVKLSQFVNNVRSDEGDLTYFMLPVLEATHHAWSAGQALVQQKLAALSENRQAWSHTGFLNPRQEGLVVKALKEPGTLFTIESHRASHDLAYATARADLLYLEQVGLLVKRKRGKGFVFETQPGWTEKLRQIEADA
jgi:hypothetical protein